MGGHHDRQTTMGGREQGHPLRRGPHPRPHDLSSLGSRLSRPAWGSTPSPTLVGFAYSGLGKLGRIPARLDGGLIGVSVGGLSGLQVRGGVGQLVEDDTTSLKLGPQLVENPLSMIVTHCVLHIDGVNSPSTTIMCTPTATHQRRATSPASRRQASNSTNDPRPGRASISASRKWSKLYVCIYKHACLGYTGREVPCGSLRWRGGGALWRTTATSRPGGLCARPRRRVWTILDACSACG